MYKLTSLSRTHVQSHIPCHSLSTNVKQFRKIFQNRCKMTFNWPGCQLDVMWWRGKAVFPGDNCQMMTSHRDVAPHTCIIHTHCLPATVDRGGRLEMSHVDTVYSLHLPPSDHNTRPWEYNQPCVCVAGGPDTHKLHWIMDINNIPTSTQVVWNQALTCLHFSVNTNLSFSPKYFTIHKEDASK